MIEIFFPSTMLYEECLKYLYVRFAHYKSYTIGSENGQWFSIVNID